MSRLFDGVSAGGGQYLSGTAPLSAVPVTVAGWFYPLATNATYDLIFLKASDSQYSGLYINPTGSSAVIGATTSANDNEATAVSPGSYTANTWHHAAGVWTSATSRQAFLNGSGGTVNTTSRVATFSNVNIGGFIAGSHTYGVMNGQIAELGVWNVALTVAEIAALAKGASPMRIRPASLVAYWPLMGTGSPEPNFGKQGSTLNLTLNGLSPPVQAPHPPIMRPFGGNQQAIMLPPTAPVGRVKIWTGSAWVLKPVKIWTGSAWVEKPAKIWNGSAWV